MKVLYIADFTLPTNRAYNTVFRMLDAFSDHKIKSIIYTYFEKKF